MSKLNKKSTKPLEAFTSFEELFEQAEKRPEFWEERAKLEFTREVVGLMKELNVSKSELASRLEVSPSMITRLLSGQNNFELSTMVRIAMALNCRYRSHLCRVEQDSMWIDVLKEEPKPQNIIQWNPENFKVIEACGTSGAELTYVPIAVNS